MQLPISYKDELKYVTVAKALLFHRVEILIDSLFTRKKEDRDCEEIL